VAGDEWTEGGKRTPYSNVRLTNNLMMLDERKTFGCSCTLAVFAWGSANRRGDAMVVTSEVHQYMVYVLPYVTEHPVLEL
jgi:hypothetical protein